MLQVALAQIKLHSRRFIAVGLAVLLAVAFLVATLLVNSSTQATLKASLGQSFAQADAVVAAGTARNDKPLDQAALAAVSQAPGVTASYAQLETSVQVTSANSSFYAALQNTAPVASLEAASLVSGTLPAAAGEIAVDEKTAERNSLSAGSTLTLASANGQSTMATVTGLVKASNDPMRSGLAQLLASTQTLAPLAELPLTYSTIQLKLDAPLNDARRAELSKALAAVGFETATVKTADQQTTASVQNFTGGNDQLTLVLLAFAAIAIIVAVLVVANTFAVLVAQRTRELGLLRCIGAKKSQIRNSVLAEAAIVGVVASAAGVAVAFGGMYALISWLKTTPGNEFATFEGNPTAPITGMLVGILLTAVAALVPARAATAVAPLAAMRPAEDAALGNRSGRVRLAIGGVLIILGGLMLAFGAISANLAIALPGGAMTFIGVLLCASLFVPRLVATFGKLAAPAGVPGKLASLNAVRNPGRTTATASALLIGVTLVSMMLTGASTARSAFETTFDERYPVDISIEAGGYDAAKVDALKSLTGVSAVAQLPVVGEVTGSSDPMLTGGSVYGISSADAAALLSSAQNRVQPGQILMPKSTKESNLSLLVNGVSTSLPVSTATSKAFFPMVNLETVQAPAGVEQAVWIKLVPGTSSSEILDLRSQIADTLGVQEFVVSGGAMEKASFNQIIDIMLLVVTGLLAIAVLIALIGVANTLSLSVLERTRENALLRALGLTKGGLRGMLALEAVLVAGVAALIGVVLGGLYGWLGAQSALGGFAAVVPNVPWLQLLLVVAVAAAAGLAASVVPARRAAKLSPVAGLASD